MLRNVQRKDLHRKNKVQCMLRDLWLHTSAVATSLDHTSASSERESSSDISQLTPTVKLLKLEMAEFTGELRHWQGFWSQFDSRISANQNISKVDKFKYLISYFTGKMAAAIAGLDSLEGNYEVALSLLKEWFGWKELNIEDHVMRLVNIKPLHDSRNLGQLRSLVDEAEIGVRSLTSLEVSVKLTVRCCLHSY